MSVQFFNATPSGASGGPARGVLPAPPVARGAPAAGTAATTPPPTDEGPHVNREILQRALDKLNRLAESFNQQLKFGLYEGTDQLYVQVLDRGSNRIIKVMPPEEFLKLHARLQKAVGVVLDEIR